jgi:acylphosphatase
VAGWVRNRPDGTVETEIEGDPEAVRRMLDWLRSGPTWASVSAVDVRDVDPTGDSGFSIT